MYVQLYTKSVYTLLSSALKIEDYVALAKERGMNALALTDENVVYGLIKFYKACLKVNIKPLLGITISIDSNAPFVLIAKNFTGYQNLLRLSTFVSLGHLKVTEEALKLHSEGLICIVPINANAFTGLLANNQLNAFTRLLRNLNFFKNDLFLGIQPEYSEEHRIINQKVLAISSAEGIEPVALNEVKYTRQEDATFLDYLRAIGSGDKISAQMDLNSKHEYFLSTGEFEALFTGYERAVSNTLKIAERCDVKINFDTLHLPRFPLPENVNSDEYLRVLCKKGLEKRLNTLAIPDLYMERLIYELKIISEMKYSDYFLIVYDFVKFAKKNNIAVGPGRGSAAGSLVAYVLGITNVDPIKYDLLFERFLNPERVTMPDIDLDFQDNRRDEVIKYVQEKYGVRNVAHIIAFGTFASRSAVREIAKVMNINEKRIAEIAGYLDANLSIEENIKANGELHRLIDEFPEIGRLFAIASAIEGLPRNTTTHAAGIIICEEDLSGLSGLQNGLDDILETQYEAKDLENLGLLKMDFLGLRNLTAISEIIDIIKSVYHQAVDLNAIPLDDAKTYRLIARGETTGVFQLESTGMRNVLTAIKAGEFEDIVAVNALFRPGPMENIPDYIARKNKTKPVIYLHPDLEPILASTYGIIVYQEQIMQIARKIAGYSLSRADLLRSLVSKKKMDRLAIERNTFVEGCVNNGYNKETGEALFDYIVKFGDYGFNRSHSVAYALISYQMAYLKANYLAPFMVVLLKSVAGSNDQTRRYIGDCRRYGIKVLPVSVNQSSESYGIESENSIRMSFLTVKGIGLSICEAILNEREKGTFKNYFDFVFRTSGFLRQNVFEALVFVGALDEFKLTRRTMIDNYGKVNDLTRFNPSGYFSDKLEININPEYAQSELMDKEKNYLGFYLLTHPMRKLLDTHPGENFITPGKTLKYLNQVVSVTGYVESMRKMLTKAGEEMCSFTLADETASVAAVVFPRNFAAVNGKFGADDICTFRCKVTEHTSKLQLIIYDVIDRKQV